MPLPTINNLDTPHYKFGVFNPQHSKAGVETKNLDYTFYKLGVFVASNTEVVGVTSTYSPRNYAVIIF